MDWYLVLTPILALAVVLLLGFTGCDVVLGLRPVPGGRLTFQVRLPAAWAVNQAKFQWTRPGSTTNETTTAALDMATDGTDALLSYALVAPEQGMWTASCRLDVNDGSRQAIDTGMAMFAIDTEETDVATFAVMGAPTTRDFKVVFVGLMAVPEGT